MKSLCLALLLLPLSAMAMERPAITESDMSPERIQETVDSIRAVMRMERKQAIEQGLPLTKEEAQTFWPLYNSYVADMKQGADDRTEAILSYAENQDKMTDDLAEKLLRQSMSAEKHFQKVREQYLSKFKKVLSGKKVARFYQLEFKLDSITNVDLARKIPLVELTP